MSSNYFRRTLPASLVALTLFGCFVMVGQTPAPANPEKKGKKRQIDESNTAAPRGQTGSAVEGVVLNPAGNPAAGSEVVLTSAEDPRERWTTKADRTGHFHFDAVLAPGHYLATATAENLTSASAKITLSGTRAAPVRLKLSPRSQQGRDE